MHHVGVGERGARPVEHPPTVQHDPGHRYLPRSPLRSTRPTSGELTGRRSVDEPSPVMIRSGGLSAPVRCVQRRPRKRRSRRASPLVGRVAWIDAKGTIVPAQSGTDTLFQVASLRTTANEEEGAGRERIHRSNRRGSRGSPHPRRGGRRRGDGGRRPPRVDRVGPIAPVRGGRSQRRRRDRTHDPGAPRCRPARCAHAWRWRDASDPRDHQAVRTDQGGRTLRTRGLRHGQSDDQRGGERLRAEG